MLIKNFYKISVHRGNFFKNGAKPYTLLKREDHQNAKVPKHHVVVLLPRSCLRFFLRSTFTQKKMLKIARSKPPCILRIQWAKSGKVYCKGTEVSGFFSSKCKRF